MIGAQWRTKLQGRRRKDLLMEFTARFSGANEVWATAWPSRMNTDAAGYIASGTTLHRNSFYDCTEFQETSAMFSRWKSMRAILRNGALVWGKH
jgi:hypothetical protein